MGDVFDGGEIRWRVVGSHAALVIAEHHVHHPVQAVLDRPMAAHDGAEKCRNDDQGCEIKSCFILDFSVRLTAAFDHDDRLQPRPVVPFLKPLDIIYHRRGSGFDATVIAIDRGVAGELCLGKVPGPLFRGEKRDVLVQRSLVAFERQDIIGLLVEYCPGRCR
jgi:hypothetical protein